MTVVKCRHCGEPVRRSLAWEVRDTAVFPWVHLGGQRLCGTWAAGLQAAEPESRLP